MKAEITFSGILCLGDKEEKKLLTLLSFSFEGLLEKDLISKKKERERLSTERGKFTDRFLMPRDIAAPRKVAKTGRG